jgi:hypothetical protein
MQHRQTPNLKFLCNSHLQDELKLIPLKKDELKFITQCTRIAYFSIQDVKIPLIQSTAPKKRMEQWCSKHEVNNSALLFHIFHIYIIGQHPSTCTKALDNIKSSGVSIPISPSPHLHYATEPRTDHATVSHLSKRSNLVVFTLWTPTPKTHASSPLAKRTS